MFFLVNYGGAMISETNSLGGPTVEIDNPKNKAGKRKGQDISDHYPIIIRGLELNIISYNLQLMHTLIGGVDGKKTVPEIAQVIHEVAQYFVEKNADVCCVQELFDNKANELIEAEMLQKGYVAAERVGKTSLAIFNGGVRTFVKKELVHLALTTSEYIYKNKIDYFIGGDALANKGMTHTGVNHADGAKTHIFNTHLQAYYANRDHYAEVTLAQCVEFKRFIEAQKAKGIIGPNDKIIICGDFNIPKPNSDGEVNFLYTKMSRLLGPQFTFLDYNFNSDSPIHTLSRKNSYNKALPDSSDMNVNVDMAILFDPNVNSSLIDLELSDIYADIQLAISHYIRKNATIFSKWLLSQHQLNELNEFNQELKELMDSAEQIKAANKNPIEQQKWFKQAVKLLGGPGKANHALSVKSMDELDIELQEITVLPDDDTSLDNLDLCKEKFDKLMHSLKQVHAEIHKNYITSPSQHKKALETSLKLNHVLLNAGDQFFKKPNATSFRKFQKLCEHELNTASKEFEKNASIWSKLSPIFKGFLGLLSALSVVPAVVVAVKSPHGFTKTFFRSRPSNLLTNIQKEFEKDPILNPKSSTSVKEELTKLKQEDSAEEKKTGLDLSGLTKS